MAKETKKLGITQKQSVPVTRCKEPVASVCVHGWVTWHLSRASLGGTSEAGRWYRHLNKRLWTQCYEKEWASTPYSEVFTQVIRFALCTLQGTFWNWRVSGTSKGVDWAWGHPKGRGCRGPKSFCAEVQNQCFLVCCLNQRPWDIFTSLPHWLNLPHQVSL
jgi:hypothetical protein